MLAVSQSDVSQSDIDNRVPYISFLEQLFHSKGILRPSQQQPAAPKQRAVQLPQNLPLRFGVKVNQYVPAEDQIEGPQRPHALAQIDRLERNHAPDRLAQLAVQ